MSRYIDADALEQHKFISWTVPEFFNEMSLEQQAYQLGWNNAIEAIMENEPTADVVEVVHGEWKPKTPLSKSYRFVCSVCGGTAYYCSGSCASVRNNVKNVCRYNYCPNCGADMRGAEDVD